MPAEVELKARGLPVGQPGTLLNVGIEAGYRPLRHDPVLVVEPA